MAASILLGTGASEGIPCAFCECPVCTRARLKKGKEIRSRSSFLIDEESIIDFPRDIFFQVLRSNVSLSRLKRIFITHFHEDHIGVEEMGCRMSASPALTEDVFIYCSKAVAEQILLLFARFRDHNQEKPFDYFKHFQPLVLEAYQTIIAGTIKCTPIISSHHGYGVGEMGYNYLMETPKSKFLYAVDTGWYEQETWDFLRGKPQDYVVMECTYGDQELAPQTREHLNIANVVEMLKRLEEIGCITRQTPIYLTHLCHLHRKDYEQTQKELDGYGFSIFLGYDGMEIKEG